VAVFESLQPSRKQVHEPIVMFSDLPSKKTVPPELSPMKGA
jgi:hypothetical protein